MKDLSEYEKDLVSIRTIMDRSAKFISLSGLSGILAGIYALGGAIAAYYTAYFPYSPFHNGRISLNEPVIVTKLVLIGTAVLGASLVTALIFSQKKSRKHDVKLWSPASQMLLFKVAVPLVVGGLFIVIMSYTGHFELAAPATLIFYGIALVHGSANTVDEIRYLGFTEIFLGLVCALYPGYGLIFWTLGFALLHIVYGAIMYNKYDR